MPDEYLRTGELKKRPVKRLLAAIIVVVLCFCGICGKVLWDARRAAWTHAAEVATSLVTTLNSDIARNIESYDLSLHAVIDNLAYPEITKVSPELRQLILFDRSADAKHLDAISMLDEKGIVRLDSRSPFPKPVSRADRDYFKFHRDSKKFELHISAPMFARDTGHAVIVISRRLSNPDGTFAGVVAGSVRLSYFEDLFKGAALGPNGNITLSHENGTLLMRWPYQQSMLGRSLSGSELYKRLAEARSGTFETTSVTDGVRRLVVYGATGTLPLIVGVGQSTSDIYAQWRNYAFTVGAAMLFLCVISIALAIYLAREMRHRNEAEARLAVLATTDALTGLSNRRSFDRAFEREWQRAMRDKTALALVMCDADHFKHYNDSHGHQAGDRLLQAVGAAMDRTIRRTTDVAARYGGDEFVILLPTTSAQGASSVAETIRSAFTTVCDEMGIHQSQLSIGVASVVPMRDQPPSLLLSVADEALYRAKEKGRNRVEVAAQPLQNFASDQAQAA